MNLSTTQLCAHCCRNLLIVTSLLSARTVQAYRPFDGTDADVARRGEFELELGMVHYHQQGPEKTLLSPMVLNLGIISNVELGADIASTESLAPKDTPRFQLTGTDVFIKVLLRSGVRQDQDGPSVAIEAGPQLPEYRGATGFGGWVNLLVSERLGRLLLHLNDEASLSRGDLHLGWRTGLIGEICVDGPVRPVTELSWQRDLKAATNTYSALGGIIWTVTDDLDLDAAGFVASIDGQRALEARFGFTWVTPVWTVATEPDPQGEPGK